MKYYVTKGKDTVTYYDVRKEKFLSTDISDPVMKSVQGVYLFQTESGSRISYDRCYFKRYLEREQLGKKLNGVFYNYACRKSNPGDTIPVFLEHYKQAPEYYQTRRENNREKENAKYPVDDMGEPIAYITGFKGIRVERAADNPDRKTFDFVRVTYSLKSSVPNDMLFSLVKDDYRFIAGHAAGQLQNSKRYLHYGIPVNFLKLTKYTVTADRLLELTFELKQFG